MDSNHRKIPGVATGGGNFSNSIKSVRDSSENIRIIPKEVADKLRGREFSNLDDFREAFGEEYSTSSYANEFSKANFDKAFDICVVQKILPKLSGSNNDILEILIKLFNLFNKTSFGINEYYDESLIENIEEKVMGKYKDSSKKLIYIIRRFVRKGFTTFWQ